MLQYILKRILIFIPTLLVISLLAFALSKMAPGDPVELLLRAGSGPAEGDLLNAERIYQETAALLGLDKPAFYFAISSQAYPDTLYRIPNKDHRSTLRNLIAQYGNWPLINEYYQRLKELEWHLQELPDTLDPAAANQIRSRLRGLYLRYEDAPIRSQLESMVKIAAGSGLPAASRQRVLDLKAAYWQITENPMRRLLHIPDIKWYGFDNQYHHWFTGFIQGDLGISYIDSRPVATKLKEALRWTLLLNGVAILLAYLLSIPLGVYSAVHRDSRFDRITTLLLFVLYSLPTFWIATLLVVFLTTPEYGLDLFPTMGVGETSPDVSFWSRFWDRAYHFVLPVFCLTYGSLAFITRQMRGSMRDTLQKDFIRTARAKGLSERAVTWKHAFRNSLFPIITLFGAVFPAVLAGSVIIEVIFNIDGMGKLTVDAITQRNWPVVYSVLMLGAILTMAGILLADVCYALVDPRVTFRK
jgi:peptide/nickel transport system permease protein